jgi:acyl-CoA synthetase (AMP-forming)/AMP-acid ligase II
MNFADWLGDGASATSALVDAASGRSWNVGAGGERIAAWAEGFRALPLRAGDRVLIASDLSPECAFAYLGCVWAGLVAVPIEAATLKTELAARLKDVDAAALWLPEGLALPPVGGIAVLKGDISKSGGGPAATRRADDIAALMATSGTTGGTRFVMATHGNLRANTEGIVRSQHLAGDELAMLVLPLHYCFGASVLHSHLAAGGSVAFDRRFMFPDKVLHAMASLGCTTFAGVPLVYRALTTRSGLGKIPLPALRRFLQAGGRLDVPTIESIRRAVPHAAFFAMYGQTEASSRISCLDPRDYERKSGSVGKPLHNLEVEIQDEQGTGLPVGTSGEICVRGPSVSPGYWRDEASTAAVLRNGWLRTGDLGHYDNEGFLWIDGRQGSFIKVRGRRVALAEIEERVAAVSGVAECAAAGVPHAEAGEAIALFVVNAGDPAGLEARVRGALPTAWDCAFVRLVPELPHTSSGKVSRVGVSRLVAEMQTANERAG